MTREQRSKSRELSAMSEAVDAFIDKPCKLSVEQTRALLNELCADLGYCLAPRDFDVVLADPPTDPRAFAELVVKLEGVGVGDAEMFMPVLIRVLKVFQAAARSAGRSGAPTG